MSDFINTSNPTPVRFGQLRRASAQQLDGEGISERALERAPGPQIDDFIRQDQGASYHSGHEVDLYPYASPAPGGPLLAIGVRVDGTDMTMDVNRRGTPEVSTYAHGAAFLEQMVKRAIAMSDPDYAGLFDPFSGRH